MNLIALFALVRKDLQLYLTDRRALILTVALPIAFASFFGFLFGGKKGEPDAAGIPVLWVDEDHSAVSRQIRERLALDSGLSITDSIAATARVEVGQGKAHVAVRVPAGFAEAAKMAIAGNGEKPTLDLWRDPSHTTELQLVRGRLTGHVVQVVEQNFFSADSMKEANASLERLEQRSDLPEDQRTALKAMRENVAKYGASQNGGSDAERGALPYRFVEQAITSASQTEYNGFSHAFAGNGVQFVLFGAIESGIAILTERQRGLWRRLRAAPISRSLLLVARLMSAAIFCLFGLMVLYLFGRVVFDVRIEGSVPGFVLTCVVYAVTASTFGLVLATLGKTPAAARAPAIFVVLVMAMLGGSMIPAFLFPSWMQQLTFAVPTRWALDALEAVTWRGQDFGSVLLPCAVLLGFSAVFTTIALTRFKWDID